MTPHRNHVETSVATTLESLLYALPKRWKQLVQRPAEQAGDDLVAADLTGRVRVEGPDGERTGRIVLLDPAAGMRISVDGGGEERLALEHVRSVARV